MPDPLWLDPFEAVPTWISPESPSGLYLSIDLAFQRVWLPNITPRRAVFIDGEFQTSELDGQSAAVFVSTVHLAIDPAGFESSGNRGKPGQLLFERGTLYLCCAGAYPGLGGQRFDIGKLKGSPEFPYPVVCSRWALTAEDINGKMRPLVEVDRRT